ncbi:hypothetical protein A616_17010 [Brevibacillus brevis X23]|nr:hypothetical protein A616_17010 [Brevibacillus brevis X23]
MSILITMFMNSKVKRSDSMKNYSIVIVYKNGLSRSAFYRKSSKAEAIQEAIESDRDVENIINITAVESIREDV